VEPRQVFDAYSPRSKGIDARNAYCGSCGARNEVRDLDGRQRAVCPSCGCVAFRNPVASISVLITDSDGRFLLCRRAADAIDGGKWCLPCGFIEYDEDFLSTARREAKEETGLDVEIVSLIGAASMFHTPERHDLAVVLLARPVSGELLPSGDIDDARWFRFEDDLPELAFEADAHLIARYRETPLAGLPVDPHFAGDAAFSGA
jgi:8-oxo-dGTP diphosphatase